MLKLSTHYRSDSEEGLDPSIQKHLDIYYLSKLQNLNSPNPKLLVVYSGGNAAGKSTLSQKISDELHGLVLENDAVRRCLLAERPELERDTLSPLVWKYTMQLYRRLDQITSNGLIVRDGVIDWYYDQILPIFVKGGYKIFIVAFDVTREKSIELVNKRGNTPTTSADRLIAILGDHEIHMNRFRNAYKPDVILNENNLYDHDLVITAIRRKLEQLH